jgi:SAM-dependent methyltransferase
MAETGRSRFAGGDQAYLKDDQYRDPSRLAARTSLHLRYGTATVPWFDWVQQTAAIPAGASVLEVGCGEGRLWEALPKDVAGLHLTLVDLSVGMVTAARRRVGHGARLRAGGAVADVQQLPFPSGSFDVVVANHMLYHAPDPASAVLEVARLLRPEGRLVAATNGARHLAELGEIRAEVFGTSPLDDTLAAFGIDTGTPMLQAAFEDVVWVGYHDRLDCTDPADVLAYLRSVPPGEGATAEQDAHMVDLVHRGFASGGGTMAVSKESGILLAHRPRPGGA